ncbi:hypothetical protein [Paenibacillus sinopodophylli]|uniref:hypothetical protein n=1 Tax=Paenibacillus sinopodophylli TaxID=1837342 RepID=UPI00110CA557|nr:hypothetical protein [Paenibacillus sinopodophylli]
MPWTTIAVVWGTTFVYGLLDRSWMSYAPRDKVLMFTILVIALLLSVGLGINPELPGLTELINGLYRPFRSLLAP